MNQEDKNRIKTKFQELMTAIKEEAVGESQEFRNDLLQAVNDVKKNIESKWGQAEAKSKGALEDAKADLDEMVKELEAKALKVQYSVQEKYSRGVEKKDAVVVKTADSLIEAIEKVKCALADTKCNKE